MLNSYILVPRINFIFNPSFIVGIARFNSLLYLTIVLSVLITILEGINHVPGDIYTNTQV